MKLTVDLTTANSVFYPLGPQGQWINHRFGRRNYPMLTLPYEPLVKSLDGVDVDGLVLDSVYGDPICYSNIDSLLTYAATRNITIQFHSHLNVLQNNTIHLLNSSDSHVITTLSGINHLADKIHQELDWNIVQSNLQLLTCKKTVIFHMYRHNICQIPQLTQFCVNNNIHLELIPGPTLSADFSSIIDQHGNWLYDVYSADSPDDTADDALVKTMEGYHALKKYRVTPSGKSILSKPMIFRTGNSPELHPERICVAVTGHVFKNIPHLHAFTNALCSDWKIEKSDVLLDSSGTIDHYIYATAATLNLIADKDFSATIISHDLPQILAELEQRAA